jgi:branched-chain amino acid transport system permease protein
VDITLFIQQFLNGLSIGSVYAIFALGYTLVFSILGIINFAHGAVFTLGAYFTYALMGGAFGFNGLLANARIPVQLPFAVALNFGQCVGWFGGSNCGKSCFFAFAPQKLRSSADGGF